MAEEVGGLKIKLGLDGAEFQQGIQQVNREMKVLESAFKAQGSGIKNFGSSLDGLKIKSTTLTGQIDLQNQKLAALKEQLEKSIEATGRYSKNSQNLQIQVNNTQKSIKTLESQLKSTNKEIDIQSSNWTKLSKTMKSTSDSLKPIGDGFKNVGTKLSVGLTTPILAAGGAAFKLASDMNETLNKVDVAFKDNAKEVKEWGNTTLEKFGISSGAALDAASLFGDMGTAMGQSTAEASKMSTNLVGLAGDLSSFKNIGLGQAQDALKGIFTGEGESLKSLGIIMQDSTLKAFALATGQTKSYTEMTQAEKVALRYAYVMGVTKNAQGDFARTSDGSANQMRIFQESIKQLATTIGQNLIPIITPIIAKLNEWAKSFSSLGPQTQKTILVIGAILAAIGPVLVIIGQLITAVSAITGAFASCSAAIAAAGGIIAVLTGPIGIAIAIIGGLIAVGVLLYNNWDIIKSKCTDLGTFLSNTWNLIKTSISNVITSIVTFVTTKFSSQIQSLQSIFSSIQSIFSNVWTIIKNIVLGAVLLILDIFTGNFTKLKTDASQIMNNIKTAFSSIWENIKSIFKNAIKIVVDTFIQMKTDISNAIVKVVDAVINGVKELPGKMLQFGIDIVQGLINGISSMINKVKSVVSDLADGITSKIRGALGIKSPSKVMMEIGGYTTEGLALGIQSQRDMVIDAMQGISTDIKVNRFTPSDSKSSGSSITIVNQGTIVGSNGMREFADMISRQISGNYGLSTGGAW